MRYKHDIKPLLEKWTSIFQVQPKSFLYNGTNQYDIGYLAEDLDALGLKDLVLYNSEGEPNAIKYDRMTLYSIEILKQQQIDIDLLKQRLGITTENNVITPAGTAGDGTVSGVEVTTFDQSIQTSLSNLGATLSQGVLSLKQVIADKLEVETATIKYLQIVSTNGDIYCTWIDNNGEWQKTKGKCADIDTASVVAVTTQPEISEPALTPAEVIDQTQTVQEVKEAVREAQESAQEAKQAAQEIKQVQKEEKAETEKEEAAEEAEEPPQSLDIASIPSISDISVDYGTALESANLPTTIDATLSDISTQSITITWDNGMPTYDGNTSGTYVFSGTLTLPENITNTNNFNVNVNVTVGQQPVEETPTIESPLEETTILIEDVSAGLSAGVWNFVKWIIMSPIKGLSSLPIVQKIGDRLAESASILQAGLLSPIQKLSASLFGR
jgi:hypothetical protein